MTKEMKADNREYTNHLAEVIVSDFGFHYFGYR